MPSVSGRAPPDSDVPAPRGTTLTRSRLHSCRTAETWAVVYGSTTAIGTAR